VARKALVNPSQLKALRDLLSLPPDGYQGVLEEYRRLRIDAQERHEAELYLGMQSFRLWLLITNLGRNRLSEEELQSILQEALSALESQDNSGYQRLRVRLKAYSGPADLEVDGEPPESPALEVFTAFIQRMELPRFAKGAEIPKAEDVLTGVLYTHVLEPLAKKLEAEEWQCQSLKESMALKAALWAATESDTTKINREKQSKATVGQLAMWVVAFLMLAGMAFGGWKMGLFWAKNSDPMRALNEAKAALKASDLQSAINHGELALELWKERKGSAAETRPVRELLSEAYAKSGQFDKSREQLQALVKNFPKEKRYQKRLKELEAASKKPKK
jgi:tetratricopeptide (TPR) repeat protein